MERHKPPFKIIFLCTGNSARGIFGEYLIGKVGGTLFQSYSAGSQPAGRVTQEELFKSLGFKPWDDRPHATRNFFEYVLSERRRVVEIQVEDDKYDDNTIVFKFDGPDPATSPYVNPNAG